MNNSRNSGCANPQEAIAEKKPTPAQIRARLAARFNRQALEQLRSEIGRLATRIDELESELAAARDWADSYELEIEFWRDHANDIRDGQTQVGITKLGQLVAIPGGQE